jgi:hypothetical protein
MLALVAPDSSAMAELRGRDPRAALLARTVLLEALGRLREPRAAQVFRQVLDGQEPSDSATAAAARGLGMFCRAEDAAYLIRLANKGARRDADAIEGMSSCRRPEVGSHLRLRLEQAKAGEREGLAKAAGRWGSSWAWQALGPRAGEEEGGVRRELAAALVAALPQARSDRKAIERAILMLDHPDTPRMLEALPPSEDLRQLLGRWERGRARAP